MSGEMKIDDFASKKILSLNTNENRVKNVVSKQVLTRHPKIQSRSKPTFGPSKAKLESPKTRSKKLCRSKVLTRHPKIQSRPKPKFGRTKVQQNLVKKCRSRLWLKMLWVGRASGSESNSTHFEQSLGFTRNHVWCFEESPKTGSESLYRKKC